MRAQRVIFWVLFALIAVVTGCGVIGVSMHADPLGTLGGLDSQCALVVCSVAALAIIAPLLSLLHSRTLRPGVMVLVSAGLVSWGIFMACLTGWPGWAANDDVLTATTIALSYLVPAGVALTVWRKAWGKAFAIVIAATFLACGALMTVALTTSGFDFDWGGAHETLILHGMFAGVLLLNVGRGDRRWFRWVGLAAVGAGVVLGLTEAVRDPNPSAWMKVAYRLSTELAGTLAAVNVLMMSRHGGLARVLRRAAVGLALALGGVLMLMTVAAYAEPLFGVVAPTMAMVWAGRVLATMIVLFPGAVFAVVLARSQARALARVAPTGVRHVMLECPTCRAVGPVSVRYGGACPQCLTRFCVTVIEPRCSECDYLLVGTAGNRCPECGTPFDRPPALAADIVKPGAAGAPAPVVAMPPTASMA